MNGAVGRISHLYVFRGNSTNLLLLLTQWSIQRRSPARLCAIEMRSLTKATKSSLTFFRHHVSNSLQLMEGYSRRDNYDDSDRPNERSGAPPDSTTVGSRPFRLAPERRAARSTIAGTTVRFCERMCKRVNRSSTSETLGFHGVMSRPASLTHGELSGKTGCRQAVTPG